MSEVFEDRPVKPVDLGVLQRRVEALFGLLASVEPHLADVHSLAFERHVGERAERTSKGEKAFYLSDVGDRRAKVALASLDAACVELARSIVEVRNCYAAGAGADTSLRGTLLGDDRGDGAAAELGQALKAQRRRRDRGEYVPVALVAQPSVPGFKQPKGTR